MIKLQQILVYTEPERTLKSKYDSEESKNLQTIQYLHTIKAV